MWQLVAFQSFDPRAPGSRNSLPSAVPGRCRFCGLSAPAVTFKKDAHAIPFALGNRYLLSQEECDACNDHGSRLEDHLAKRLTVARAMSRIPGRSGGVKHRFGDRPSSIESDPANNRLVVDRHVGDDSFDVTRIPEGLRYAIKVPAHRPLDAMRAIARLGFMLVPTADAPQWDHIRRWIRGELHWPGAFMHEGFIPGTGLLHVSVGVEAHAAPSPAGAMFRVGLAYSTVLLSLHLPAPDMALSDAPVPVTGRSPYPPHEVAWRRLAVTAEATQPSRHETIDICVPDLAKLPRPNHREIAEAAYFRWLARGGPAAPKAAVDDWLNGEQQLLWSQVPGAPHPWPPMPGGK